MAEAFDLALTKFKLDRDSNIHGLPHWVRVRRNGMRLLELETGMNTLENREVVALFAALHDCCRESDAQDPLHGARAAQWVRDAHRVGVLVVPARLLEDLIYAIEHHSAGLTRARSALVMVCWDADRLDLTRIGVRPDHRRMCTESGKMWARNPKRARRLPSEPKT